MSDDTGDSFTSEEAEGVNLVSRLVKLNERQKMQNERANSHARKIDVLTVENAKLRDRIVQVESVLRFLKWIGGAIGSLAILALWQSLMG